MLIINVITKCSTEWQMEYTNPPKADGTYVQSMTHNGKNRRNMSIYICAVSDG